MRTLGVDPGYERLGIAVIDGPRGKESLVYSECFKTSKNIPFEDRLLLLGRHFKDIIGTHGPELLAIENLFISKNQKTAMRVAEVRGAILFLAKEAGLEIAEYTPLQVKNAIVGYGKSEKQQVALMLHHLISIPRDRKIIDDEYDAIALALTGSACFRG